MLYSKSFIKTLREPPRGANSLNQILLVRGAYISQIGSGIFGYLPLGYRVFEKIQNIIVENLRSIGVLDCLLPVLHPAELWKKSGRFESIGDELIRISTKKADEFVLAMTHEEVISFIAREKIRSFQDLPLILGQISKKIRNETRPRGGLIRLREFHMQDAYSFHSRYDQLDKTFNDFIGAYKKIFAALNLKPILVEADPGMMGGKDSQEFMLLNPVGEDTVFICPKCHKAYNGDVVPEEKICPIDQESLKQERAIELAHVFKLGSKYSETLDLKFTDEGGAQKPVIMGCYGLGLDRLIAAVVEQSHDECGIIWPETIAPYKVYLIDLEGSRGQEIYDDLKKAGVEVLFDDRPLHAGVKFLDADLLGIPYRVVISEKTLKEKQAEIKPRDQEKSSLIDLDKIGQELRK